MFSERSWVLINDFSARLSFCGLYLRVKSPRSSDLYKNNSDLLIQLEQEKFDLESRGYAMTFSRDFNVRIEPGPSFKFSNYPHIPNINGMLVTEFARRNQLHYLHLLKWRGQAEEKFTYQHDMGEQIHHSIIHFALATSAAANLTVSFSVEVIPCFSFI